MEPDRINEPRPEDRPLSEATPSELFDRLMRHMGESTKHEVELAKSEMKSNLETQVEVAKGLTMAGMLGMLALNVFAAAIVLALAPVIVPWAAALIVAVIAGIGAFVAAKTARPERAYRRMRHTGRVFDDEAHRAGERLAGHA